MESDNPQKGEKQLRDMALELAQRLNSEGLKNLICFAQTKAQQRDLLQPSVHQHQDR